MLENAYSCFCDCHPRLGARGGLHDVAGEQPHHSLAISLNPEHPFALARAHQVHEAREPEPALSNQAPTLRRNCFAWRMSMGERGRLWADWNSRRRWRTPTATRGSGIAGGEFLSGADSGSERAAGGSSSRRGHRAAAPHGVRCPFRAPGIVEFCRPGGRRYPLYRPARLAPVSAEWRSQAAASYCAKSRELAGAVGALQRKSKLESVMLEKPH